MKSFIITIMMFITVVASAATSNLSNYYAIDCKLLLVDKADRIITQCDDKTVDVTMTGITVMSTAHNEAMRQSMQN